MVLSCAKLLPTIDKDLKNQMKKNINLSRWFYIFASAHLFFWTLLPSILRYTLPLDAMEGTTWGRQLAWGYDKDPFLNAWLTELGVHVGGKSGWLVYFLGQLSVVICFWAIWKLGKKILSPVHALIAVFLLEAISSYNIDSIDFDDNVLELSLWALLMLFFYSAVKHQKIKDWFLVGVFAGLALMAKYYVLILFLPMFIYLLINAENRISFKKPGLYLAIVVCLAIIAPHVIWLFKHNFLTIQYTFMRAATRVTWLGHFVYPLQFLIPLLEACVPPLILFGVLYLGSKKGEVLSARRAISADQWWFLSLMAFGPLVLTLLLSLISGAALHAGWGLPLLSLWGVVLLAWTQPVVTPKRFYRFVTVLFVLLIVAWSTYTVATVKPDTSSGNYPGQVMATRIEKIWHDRYHTPLSYIIGPRWEAGVISFYSKDRPAVLIHNDYQVSFWIDKERLKKKGAVVVWDLSEVNWFKAFKKEHPEMVDSHVVQFHWMRGKHLPPIKLGIAFLPPK